VSLDQAVANHQAGTAPLLDELRARVDYQTQQQTLISAQNQYEKDKIALARTIGLPLEQSYELADQAPFKALDNVDVNAAVQQGLAHRQDLQALQQQVEGARASRSAATAERYPTIALSADYGDIGPTLGHSHGTFDAVGTASAPLFEEAKLRGDARDAQAQLEQKQAQLNDLRGQIGADVRNSILDIEAAAKQVSVATSKRITRITWEVSSGGGTECGIRPCNYRRRRGSPGRQQRPAGSRQSAAQEGEAALYCHRRGRGAGGGRAALLVALHVLRRHG
jgi:outer membrane protein TolC